MKKYLLLLMAVLLLLGGCKPAEDEEIRIGTEDGGGSGYGVSTKSVLKLSDFYFLTHQSTRENNQRLLGSPTYTLDDSDTYLLEDGCRIVLTYNGKDLLADTLYTDITDNKNYDLFAILVRDGVLKESVLSPDSSDPSNGEQAPSEQTAPNLQGGAVFSKKSFKKAAFDTGLSLYLDRASVLATFGPPSYFQGRSYQKDSYIIDCYKLTDGSVLMLDYGFDRKSLRAAAIREVGGITSGYLGTWSLQSKPADFVRPRVTLNQITSLSKNSSPEKVYQKIGEPAWYEGSTTSYQDVYLLEDGSSVYLNFDSERKGLTSARQLTVENKWIEVALG